MTGISDIFSFGFMQRALLAGVFIALACAALGVLLVLRRLSLIGDGLAHVTFGSVALGMLFGKDPLLVSLPVVAASAFGVMKLMKRARLFGDAAIGVVSAAGIASGVVIASIAGGFNVDLLSFLFGNILSISTSEVVTAVILAVVVLACMFRYYRAFFVSSFDEEFAKASGLNTDRIDLFIGVLTAVTVVLAMKIVGIMLTSALLILPAVTALQVARSFRQTVIVACACAVGSVLLGIAISFMANMPTGALIVITNILFFIASLAARLLIRSR